MLYSEFGISKGFKHVETFAKYILIPFPNKLLDILRLMGERVCVFEWLLLMLCDCCDANQLLPNTTKSMV